MRVGQGVRLAMAYPPPHHLLRDLRATSCWISEDELHVYAPVQPAATDAQGLQLGVIAAAIDIAGGQAAMSAIDGDWCATSDLSYQRSGGVTEGPMVISTKVLRAGSRVITMRSEVFDGRGEERPTRHAGTGVMTFSRIPREAANHDVPLDRGVTIGERTTMSDAGSGFAESPQVLMGLIEHGPGELELEKSGYVLNSFGTVNGGATAIAMATAAQSVVPGATAVDISIRYVGQAGPGPVRTVSRAMADYDSYVSVDIELLDTSDDDRVIALATVGLTRE